MIALLITLYIVGIFVTAYIGGRLEGGVYSPLAGLSVAWPVVVPVLLFVYALMETASLGERHSGDKR